MKSKENNIEEQEEIYNKGKVNSDIDLDFVVKFKDLSGVIYEIREKDINANEEDLQIFFSNLQKTIKMLETTTDKF